MTENIPYFLKEDSNLSQADKLKIDIKDLEQRIEDEKQLTIEEATVLMEFAKIMYEQRDIAIKALREISDETIFDKTGFYADEYAKNILHHGFGKGAE